MTEGERPRPGDDQQQRDDALHLIEEDRPGASTAGSSQSIAAAFPATGGDLSPGRPLLRIDVQLVGDVLWR